MNQKNSEFQRIQLLKEENETYKKNFESVIKTFFFLKKYIQLRKKYVKYANHHNVQKKIWEQEIKSKTEEFELLKNRFDKETSEFKTLQMKLFEETEMKNRLKKDLETSDKFRKKGQS